MDHLKQLRSFVSAATLGSFSAAAREEGVLPAVIASRIDALEDRLGVQLILRTSRGISLTDTGADFFDSAKQILGDLELAETAASSLGKSATGTLRITAPTSFGRRYIAPLLPRLLTLHPELKVSLDLNDQFEQLLTKSFDCAIYTGSLPESNLVGVKIADFQRVVVASPAYIARHGSPQHPSDLKDHNCLCFSPRHGGVPRWTFNIDGAYVEQPVSGRLECTDGSAIYRWVLDGCGLAWRSLWEVKADIESGRLVSMLDEYAMPVQGIYAVYARRRLNPLKITVFIEFLREAYRQAGARSHDHEHARD